MVTTAPPDISRAGRIAVLVILLGELVVGVGNLALACVFRAGTRLQRATEGLA
ncbi:hypothetical protein [Protaetiibacter larvae]|uniref:hypothetical protein n=1 Tax=Protaetiibacter larvae TaxID=2592654 RepID=UPI00143CEA77|nr:hypothetical protein [Protaetiibacter larvae]